MQKEISVDSFKAREISERELAVDMVYCWYRLHVGTAQNICGIKATSVTGGSSQGSFFLLSRFSGFHRPASAPFQCPAWQCNGTSKLARRRMVKEGSAEHAHWVSLSMVFEVAAGLLGHSIQVDCGTGAEERGGSWAHDAPFVLCSVTALGRITQRSAAAARYRPINGDPPIQ